MCQTKCSITNDSKDLVAVIRTTFYHSSPRELGHAWGNFLMPYLLVLTIQGLVITLCLSFLGICELYQAKDCVLFV